ncbi:hypothetical protein [Burkholderia cenocepacia]|uniref:hypothetical protein n=1 Tax=Burkholderia cenocepacia TaxID=95486 RepID=UPI001F4BBCEB|nr:hypothetical protein [Burkholderia cenocepacia]
MTTNENPAAVRVCAIADIQCSRDCGTGACKREQTTEKSRADALTAMADDMRAEQTYLGSCRESCDNDGRIRWDRLQRVIDHLTASPSSQPAAAPIPLKAQLRRVMDLLDTHLGDSDPTLEGMTQEEIEEEFPVVAAMQIIVGLYQDPPTASDTAPSPADERAAFEAWWLSDVPEEHRAFAKKQLDGYGPDYAEAPGVADAWTVWRAACTYTRAASANETRAGGSTDLAERAQLAAGQWANSNTPIAEALAYRDGFIAGARSHEK